MSVQTGQSVAAMFTTRAFATGIGVNADSLPTGVLYLNGTANAATVTITNISTGLYKAIVTMPTLAVGDEVELVISATVSSVSDKDVVWNDSCDGAFGGGGAYTVTITVNDGTDPLQNAWVRLTSGAVSYALLTDASGVATFTLDAATWTVAIALGGYSFTQTTLVVSTDTTHTYSMTATSITPSSPSLVTTYGYVYDETMTPAEGVTVTCTLVALPTGIVGAVSKTLISSTSAADGLIEFPNRIPGAKYKYSIDSVDRLNATLVPASATTPVQLPNFIY
jgi:predicted aspartyl protease